MFEHQQELERAQGFRGPATRFFGPLQDQGEARLVVRDMSISLLLISAVLLALLWRAGWRGVVFASILGVPAAILLVTKSRTAAVLLAIAAVGLAVWTLIRSGQPNLIRLLIWLGILAITQRAFRAAFKANESPRPSEQNPGAA
jgi:hypothetical protein